VIAGLARRSATELRLVAIVLAFAAAAWALTVDRMAGMDAGPGTELGRLGWFAVSWLAMMAAMMLPALAPMVAVYGARARRPLAAAVFAGAYLLVWLAAGLLGYAAIEAVRSLEPGYLSWGEAGRYVAAGVIAGAGLYQLTVPKAACLRRCRERRAFLRERWRAGILGAASMGAEHGGYCVGASWALMAALFALGVMSLTWMAVVAVLIVAERLLSPRLGLVVAVVLVMLGAWVAFAPGDVPALHVPGGSSMDAMPMG
jgi:predicted metal-binding membrane protein